MIAAFVEFWVLGVPLIYASTWVTQYAGFVGLFVHALSMFVPAMTIAWFVCRRARSAGLSWRRAVLACLPILAVAFLFNSWLSLGDLDPEAHGTLTMGINLPLSGLFGPAIGKPSWALPAVWTPLGRVALPLCVMLWMFVRERALAAAVVLKNCESRDSGTGDAGRLAAREAA